MAYLHNVPFRPACVVSSLPKRFRESLTKDLEGTVSISTCPLHELETAVQQRCATLAVVGVSGASLDVAERLSHNQNNVKVFLAHYNNTVDENAPKNGFAGVFDLRAESKRLAESIRQSIAANQAFHPSVDRRVVTRRPINLLAKFIEMHERIPNPAALMESMLETFIELTGSSEALLLTPFDLQRGLFTVEAARGEDTIPFQGQVTLEKCWLQPLQQGVTCIAAEGVNLLLQSALQGPAYSMATPVIKDGQLCALLIGDSPIGSDILDQYVEGLSYLFRQLSKRKIQAEKELLLHNVRRVAGTNWILVDGRGKVAHREGAIFSEASKEGRLDLHPRLLDLIHRALLGESGEAFVRDKIVSYQPFQLNRRNYAILRAQVTSTANCSSDPALVAPELIGLLLRSTTRIITEHPTYDELVANLSSPHQVSFDIKRLEPLGITQATASSDMPDSLTSGLGLILLVAKGLLQRNLTASYFSISEEWHFTVQTTDEDTSMNVTDLTKNYAFQLALQLAKVGKVCLKQSIYGLQLSGTYHTDQVST